MADWSSRPNPVRDLAAPRGTKVRAKASAGTSLAAATPPYVKDTLTFFPPN